MFSSCNASVAQEKCCMKHQQYYQHIFQHDDTQPMPPRDNNIKIVERKLGISTIWILLPSIGSTILMVMSRSGIGWTVSAQYHHHHIMREYMSIILLEFHTKHLRSYSSITTLHTSNIGVFQYIHAIHVNSYSIYFTLQLFVFYT